MAKTKLERIADIENEMEELRKLKAKLRQEQNADERKARTHRLCRRGGLVEKLLPGLAALTDEQFDSFVKRTLLTGIAEKIINEIASAKPNGVSFPGGNNLPAQERETAEHITPRQQAQPNAAPSAKPAAGAPGANRQALG